MRSWVFILVLGILGASLALGGDSATDRYAGSELGESVRVVDGQGIETVATGFGKLFSLPALTAFRGDSVVQVPFERIRTLSTGTVSDNRLPVRLTLVSGRELDVVLDRTEYEAIYGGRTDFGFFRIPLESIRTLEFRRPENRHAELGQRCGRGHLWYNGTWRFCPLDGLELAPLAGEGSEGDAPR